MARLRNIVDNLFLVEKNLSKEALKIFYNVDIFIHNPNSSIPPTPITNTSNVVAQAPEVVQQQKTESFRSKIKAILNEDDPTQPIAPEPVPETQVPEQSPTTSKDFIKKTSGEINVERNEVSNIQTLEDLIDFISDKKERSGNKIMDEVSIELILAMAGASNTSLDTIVKKEDKIIIEINYGHKRDDCIGFKILKRNGVTNVSIVMEKDGDVIDSPFDLKQFNSQLVLFRNSVMGK